MIWWEEACVLPSSSSLLFSKQALPSSTAGLVWHCPGLQWDLARCRRKEDLLLLFADAQQRPHLLHHRVHATRSCNASDTAAALPG